MVKVKFLKKSLGYLCGKHMHTNLIWKGSQWTTISCLEAKNSISESLIQEPPSHTSRRNFSPCWWSISTGFVCKTLSIIVREEEYNNPLIQYVLSTVKMPSEKDHGSTLWAFQSSTFMQTLSTIQRSLWNGIQVSTSTDTRRTNTV